MRVWQRGLKLMVLFGWMALLAYWSDQGKLPIDQPAVASVLHGVQHKFAHFVAFGLLGILARWAVDGLPRATLWAVALTSAFGATDEWHQAFVPGRRSAIDDWALDTSAAMLAVYAMNRLRATRWRAYARIVAPASRPRLSSVSAWPHVPSRFRTYTRAHCGPPPTAHSSWHATRAKLHRSRRSGRANPRRCAARRVLEGSTSGQTQAEHSENRIEQVGKQSRSAWRWWSGNGDPGDGA
jgi:VanZ family protein